MSNFLLLINSHFLTVLLLISASIGLFVQNSTLFSNWFLVTLPNLQYCLKVDFTLCSRFLC